MKSLELSGIEIIPPKYSDLIEVKTKFKQLQLIWLNNYFSTGDLVASEENRNLMQSLLKLFQVVDNDAVMPDFDKAFTSPELVEECFLSLVPPSQSWITYQEGEDGIPKKCDWDFKTFLTEVQCPKLMDLCGFRNVKQLIVEAISSADAKEVVKK